MTRQKDKGTRVEHEAAAFLTQIFGLTFSRTVGSGMFGRFKDDLKGDVRVDVLPGAEYPKYAPIVEVKSLKTLSIENVVRVDAVVRGWLEQAFVAGGTQALLIAKLDRTGWAVVLHPEADPHMKKSFAMSKMTKVSFEVSNNPNLPECWPDVQGFIFFASLRGGSHKEREASRKKRKKDGVGQ